MHTYEVEIKVLLGNEINKNDFMERVHTRFSDMQHEYSESQKNHYFEGGDLRELERVLFSFLGEDALMRLRDIQVRAKSFSVRTRGTIENTIIVVKATVNDESSSNGTARIEWEIDLAPMTLEELDAYVLSAGFTYQAKWSRARDSYLLDGRTILCLDKNAGYGYLAEFEQVLHDANTIQETRTEILSLIESLGYKELDQDRLARMFDHYNKNWSEYYGTEKVFTLE